LFHDVLAAGFGLELTLRTNIFKSKVQKNWLKTILLTSSSKKIFWSNRKFPKFGYPEIGQPIFMEINETIVNPQTLDFRLGHANKLALWEKSTFCFSAS
jgi:hypothetical protein